MSTPGRTFLGIHVDFWTGLSGAISLVGLVALLFGGGFALFEYLDRKSAARVEETLRLIDIWDANGIRASYQALSRAAIELAEEIDSETRAEARNNALLEENLRRNVGNRLLAAPGQTENFENVVYFLTRMALCVEAGLCAKETVDVFFGDTLRSFVWIFEPEFEDRRRLFPNYGQEIEALATRLSSIAQ